MKIINVVNIINGIVAGIESWPIDDELAETNKNFFTEKDAIAGAEACFSRYIMRDIPYLSPEEIKVYIDKRYISYPSNKVKYEIMIFWSGINENE